MKKTFLILIAMASLGVLITSYSVQASMGPSTDPTASAEIDALAAKNLDSDAHAIELEGIYKRQQERNLAVSSASSNNQGSTTQTTIATPSAIDLKSNDGYGAGDGGIATSGGSGTSSGGNNVSDSGTQASGTFNASGSTMTGKPVAGAITWTEGINDLVAGQSKNAAAKPGQLAGVGGGSGGGGLFGGGSSLLSGLGIDTSKVTGALSTVTGAIATVNKVAGVANKVGINTSSITNITSAASSGITAVNNAGNMASNLASKASSMASNTQSTLGNLNLGSAASSLKNTASSLTSGGSLSLASAKDTLQQVRAGAGTVSGMVAQGKEGVAGIKTIATQGQDIVKSIPGT